MYGGEVNPFKCLPIDTLEVILTELLNNYLFKCCHYKYCYKLWCFPYLKRKKNLLIFDFLINFADYSFKALDEIPLIKIED